MHEVRHVVHSSHALPPRGGGRARRTPHCNEHPGHPLCEEVPRSVRHGEGKVAPDARDSERPLDGAPLLDIGVGGGDSDLAVLPGSLGFGAAGGGAVVLVVGGCAGGEGFWAVEAVEFSVGARGAVVGVVEILAVDVGKVR